MRKFSLITLVLFFSFTSILLSWTNENPAAGYGGRYGHQMVEFNGKLWVIGGKTPSGNMDDVWSSVDGINWIRETEHAAFSPRHNHRVTEYNGKLWLTAGWDSTTHFDDVWHSTDGITWTQAGTVSTFTARRNAACVNYNGKLWMIGGQDQSGTRLSDVWYTEDGEEWIQATADAGFGARFGHSCVIFHNRIYMYGGRFNNGTDAHDVWYSEDGTTWTQASASGGYTSSIVHDAIVYNGRVMIIAGLNGSTDLSEVWVSLDGESFTLESSDPGFAARFNANVAELNGKVWLSGGRDMAWNYYSDIWSYETTPVLYDLTVNIEPTDAITAGALWQIQGESTWHNSGESVPYHENTGYTIVFNDLSAWAEPDPITGIMPGTDDTVSGTYIEFDPGITHNLTVNIAPAQAVTDGAMWKLTSAGTWNASGTSVQIGEGLNYEIEFKPVSGWSSPSNISGMMENNDQAINTDYSRFNWNLAASNAAFDGRYGHQIIEFNNKLWIIAGKTTTGNMDDVWSSIDGINWIQEIEHAGFSPRHNHRVTEYDGKLWLTAGWDSSTHFDDVWHSTDGINWTQAGTVSTFSARRNPACVNYNGKLWLIGGQDQSGTRLSDVWYTEDGEEWIQATADAGFGARFGHSCLIFHNRIYMYGGRFNDNSEAGDVWYTEDGTTWIQASASGGYTPSIVHDAIAYNGRVMIIAGLNGSTDLSEVWTSLDGETFILESSEPGFDPKFNAKAAEFNGKVYLTGGRDMAWNYYSDVWSYEATPVLYDLTVNIEPANAVTAGAQWQVQGETTWHNSGDAVPYHVNTGYTIVFNDLSAWAEPDPITGVMPGADETVSGTYIEFDPGITHNLTVNIAPAQAITDGAMWRLYGTGTWNASGTSVQIGEGLAYEIEFRPVQGWSVPSNISGIMENEDQTFNSNYERFEWTLAASNAAFNGRYGHQMLEFNNKLWIIGGKTQAANMDDVWSSVDGINWVRETEHAGFSPRHNHRVTEYNGKLWLTAGWNSSTHFDDVWYSTDGINWTQAGTVSTFTARRNAACVSFGGKLWLIGGQNQSGTRLSDVWYTEDGEEWIQATADAGFGARFGHSCVIFNDRIYMYGGRYNDGTDADDIWYTADGTNWVQASASGGYTSSIVHDAIAYNGRVMIIAGLSGSTDLSEVWTSLDGETFTLESSTPGFAARFNAKVAEFNGKVWLTGGRDMAWNYYSDIWSYETDITSYLLTVYLNPAEIIPLGAKWKLAGETEFRESGESVPLNDGDEFEVVLTEVPGWYHPENLTGIINGTDFNYFITYSKHSYDVTINIDPQTASNSGARWRFVTPENDDVWKTSGQTFSMTTGGSFTIEFNDVYGWTKPDPINATVGTEDLTVTGIYTSDYAGGDIYVTHTTDNEIWDVSLSNNQVSEIIPASISPWDIIFNKEGDRAYFSVKDSNQVGILNTETNQVLEYIDVGLGPQGLTLMEDENYLCVANSLSNTFSTIFLPSSEVVSSPEVGGQPQDVVAGPGEDIYVAVKDENSVKVRDYLLGGGGTGLPIPVGSEPFCLEISPEGYHIYVTCPGDNSVSVIDMRTNTLSHTIDVGSNPSHLAFSPDGEYVYVVNNGENNVSVINRYLEQVIDTIEVGTSPNGIAILPDGVFAYVTNTGDDTLSIINTEANVVVDTISLGDSPYGIAVKPSELYTPYHRLTVFIEPIEVRDDARWIEMGIDYWEKEHAEIAMVQEGKSYEVTFSDVLGWYTPAQITGIMPTHEIQVTGVYTIKLVQLMVEIEPQGAIDADAQWQLDGETEWRDTGTTVNLQEGATYNIVFKTIDNWIKPSPIIDVMGDTPVIETGIYQPEMFALTVNIEPSDAVTDGAMWRFVGDATWQTPKTVSIQNGEEYHIEFLTIDDWTTPAQIDGIINSSDVTVTGVYTEIGPPAGPFDCYMMMGMIVNSPYGGIDVIDTETNTVVTTIELRKTPKDMEFRPQGDFVYVAHAGGGYSTPDIFVVDLNTNTISDSIEYLGSACSGPLKLAIDAGGNFLYANHSGGVNSTSHYIDVIDTNTNTWVGSFSASSNPYFRPIDLRVIKNPNDDKNYLFAIIRGNNKGADYNLYLTIFDCETKNIVATIYDPLYRSDYNDMVVNNEMLYITAYEIIPGVTNRPYIVEINPYTYTSNYTASISNSYHQGLRIAEPAYDFFDNKLYIRTTEGPNTVKVFDTLTQSYSVPSSLSLDPNAPAAISPDGKYGYFYDHNNAAVFVIATEYADEPAYTTIAIIPVSIEGSGYGFDIGFRPTDN